MGTLTMKFGGSVVGTPAALKQLVQIVQQEHQARGKLVLIVSALDGITDQLHDAIQQALLDNRRGYRRIAANLRTRHLALINQLSLGDIEQRSLEADIDQLFFDLLALCQKLAETTGDVPMNDTMDAILGFGERLSARIIAAFLRQHGLRGVALDATHLIVTDDVYGNATPDMELTRKRVEENLLPLLERGIIPVVTGFIGATKGGKPTTLGRGGSDYTASVISAIIQAEEVWMWSDVEGMMTCDPNIFRQAKVIPELNYEELAEMAYFGAKIIHTKMIWPLREHNIPLRVRGVFTTEARGTLVHANANTDHNPIKAVTAIQGIGLFSERSGTLVEITQLVDTLLFDVLGTRAEVTISAQSASRSFICFVIPTSAGPEAVRTMHAELSQKLNNTASQSHWETQPVSIVTVVGSKLDTQAGITAKVLQALDGIRILALAQGPSYCSLSVVINPKMMRQAIEKIHALL